VPLDQLAWGVYVHEAARQLERAGDHAVDIAEQVWFLVTGQLEEFDGAPSAPASTSSGPTATTPPPTHRSTRPR